MRSLVAVLAAVALVCGLDGGLLAQEPLSGAKAFETLRTLVGQWEARVQSGGVIRVGYRSMSGNSILVESFQTPSGQETLSVYHLDGHHLLVTHYCGQGNQPRLRYDPRKSGSRHLLFEYLDATNLPSMDKEHMHRLGVRLVDRDHFDQSSTYRVGKKEETTTLRFVRAGIVSGQGSR